ncbi:hypothetical protein JW877_02825, partial [bacterium]|nr:hypothetical protein [bacterium]
EENVRMFMEIPEDQGWYNHHWLLGISALPIPDPEIPGGSISLGAYLLYRFETEADAKAVPTVGHNELVIVPSTLIFNDVVPGELYQKQVKIYHPFRTGKKCYVESLDPASDVAKWTILPSPGYPRLQNSEWIAYDSSLVLSPDQPSTFDIFLQTPPTDLTKTHEILLFMPQGTGTKSFLRVKINFKVNKSGN